MNVSRINLKKTAEDNLELCKSVIALIDELVQPCDNIGWRFLELLKIIRQPQLRLFKLEQKSRRLNSILDDLERAYAMGDSFGDGMPRAPISTANTVEARHLKIREYKEELGALAEERASLLSAIDKNENSPLRKFIRLIPQSTYCDIFELYWLDSYNTGQIMTKTGLSKDYVCKVKTIALNELQEILLKALKL